MLKQQLLARTIYNSKSISIKDIQTSLDTNQTEHEIKVDDYRVIPSTSIKLWNHSSEQNSNFFFRETNSFKVGLLMMSFTTVSGTLLVRSIFAILLCT